MSHIEGANSIRVSPKQHSVSLGVQNTKGKDTVQGPKESSEGNLQLTEAVIQRAKHFTIGTGLA
jgi:hypothetical protein